MSNRTLSKKLANVKSGTLFVGVDLALDRNVAVVFNECAERSEICLNIQQNRSPSGRPSTSNSSTC